MSRRYGPRPVLPALLSTIFAMLTTASAGAGEFSRVYRCTSDGVVTYADRPCGATTSAAADPMDTAANAGSFLLRVDPAGQPGAEIEGPAEAAPAATLAGAASRAAPQRTAAKARERKILSCAALQRRIDRVNSQMRAGYRGARGEQLRNRWRDLKSRYYDEKCLGVH